MSHQKTKKATFLSPERTELSFERPELSRRSRNHAGSERFPSHSVHSTQAHWPRFSAQRPFKFAPRGGQIKTRFAGFWTTPGRVDSRPSANPLAGGSPLPGTTSKAKGAIRVGRCGFGVCAFPHAYLCGMRRSPAGGTSRRLDPAAQRARTARWLTSRSYPRALAGG